MVLGVNVRNRERLFAHKQMIIVANHNSHLDTMALMNLFPFRDLKKIRPVGAMDYFHSTRFRKWFASEIVRFVPLNRESTGGRRDPLANCSEAINGGDSLILFPEGTRGEPEKLEKFKAGVAHLVKRFPDVAVVPVFMYGMGKVLPKGEFLPVPYFCDVFVGEHFYWNGGKKDFMAELDLRMKQLADECV